MQNWKSKAYYYFRKSIFRDITCLKVICGFLILFGLDFFPFGHFQPCICLWWSLIDLRNYLILEKEEKVNQTCQPLLWMAFSRSLIPLAGALFGIHIHLKYCASKHSISSTILIVHFIYVLILQVFLWFYILSLFPLCFPGISVNASLTEITLKWYLTRAFFLWSDWLIRLALAFHVSIRIEFYNFVPQCSVGASSLSSKAYCLVRLMGSIPTFTEINMIHFCFASPQFYLLDNCYLKFPIKSTHLFLHFLVKCQLFFSIFWLCWCFYERGHILFIHIYIYIYLGEILASNSARG